MLIKGNLGEKYLNFLYYSGNFYVSLKLFQNKVKKCIKYGKLNRTFKKKGTLIYFPPSKHKEEVPSLPIVLFIGRTCAEEQLSCL